MKHLLFDKQRPALVVKYINSDNSVTYTNNAAEAMQFETSESATQFIEDNGLHFLGTRPVHRPK